MSRVYEVWHKEHLIGLVPTRETAEQFITMAILLKPNKLKREDFEIEVDEEGGPVAVAPDLDEVPLGE